MNRRIRIALLPVAYALGKSLQQLSGGLSVRSPDAPFRRAEKGSGADKGAQTGSEDDVGAAPAVLQVSLAVLVGDETAIRMFGP